MSTIVQGWARQRSPRRGDRCANRRRAIAVQPALPTQAREAAWRSTSMRSKKGSICATKPRSTMRSAQSGGRASNAVGQRGCPRAGPWLMFGRLWRSRFRCTASAARVRGVEVFRGSRVAPGLALLRASGVAEQSGAYETPRCTSRRGDPVVRLLSSLGALNGVSALHNAPLTLIGRAKRSLQAPGHRLAARTLQKAAALPRCPAAAATCTERTH